MGRKQRNKKSNLLSAIDYNLWHYEICRNIFSYEEICIRRYSLFYLQPEDIISFDISVSPQLEIKIIRSTITIAHHQKNKFKRIRMSLISHLLNSKNHT